jgi:hypothetical protein
MANIVGLLPEPYKYIFENLCRVYQHLDETNKKDLKTNLLSLIDILPFEEIANIANTGSRNGIASQITSVATMAVGAMAKGTTKMALKQIIKTCETTNAPTTPTNNDQINTLATTVNKLLSDVIQKIRQRPLGPMFFRYMEHRNDGNDPSIRKLDADTKTYFNGIIAIMQQVGDTFKLLVSSINTTPAFDTPALSATSDDDPSPDIIINSVKSLQDKANALQKQVDELKAKCKSPSSSQPDAGLKIVLYDLHSSQINMAESDHGKSRKIIEAIDNNDTNALYNFLHNQPMFGDKTKQLNDKIKKSAYFLHCRTLIPNSGIKVTPFQYACYYVKEKCIIFLLSCITMGGKDTFLKHIFLPIDNLTSAHDDSDEDKYYARNAFEIIDKADASADAKKRMINLLSDTCSLFEIYDNNPMIVKYKIIHLSASIQERFKTRYKKGGSSLRVTRKLRPAL